MQVVERTARRDWFIEAENGDRQDVHAGKSYTTTRSIWPDGTVTLFSGFWVRVPIDVFEEPVCKHCGSPLTQKGDSDA